MARSHDYHVCIVASPSRTLYVGVTNDLERRIWQHRHKTWADSRRRIIFSRLVWFEWFTRIDDAIAAEKRIKGWSRIRSWR